MANDKRLEILELLKKNPGLNVLEIARYISLHYKSTSKHLQKLSEAGLISSNRDGIWVRCALTKKTDQLIKFIKHF